MQDRRRRTSEEASFGLFKACPPFLQVPGRKNCCSLGVASPYHHAGAIGWAFGNKAGRLGYGTYSPAAARVMSLADHLPRLVFRRPMSFDNGIVVSCAGGLGDLFIHLPLLEGLAKRAATQGVPFSVALPPALVPIAVRLGWDTVELASPLVSDFTSSLRQTARSLSRYLRTVRKFRHRLWIEICGNLIDASLLWLGGARCTVMHGARGGRALIHHLIPESTGNEYETAAHTARFLGIAPQSEVFDRLAPESGGSSLIVVAVHSHCPWRNLPWATLKNLIRSLPSEKFVITGRRTFIADASEAEFQDLFALPNVVNLLDRQTILEHIALVTSARAVIAVDSGPAHIGIAYGRPGVMLFGPSDVRRWWRPGGRLKALVEESCPHHPCIQWPCAVPDRRCMRALTAERIAEALQSALAPDPQA